MLIKQYTYKKPKELIFKEKNPRSWQGYVREFKLYEYDKKHKVFILPRIEVLPSKSFELNSPIFDNYIQKNIWEKLDKEKQQKQRQAVKELLKQNYGLLTSWVWSWKTWMIFMTTESLLRVGYKVVIIVPKREIYKQFVREAYEIFWENSVWTINDIKKGVIKPILIIVQRSFDLYWRKYKLDKHYKAVLIDEAHMNNTKNRKDFLIHYEYDVLYWYTGTPELSERDDKMLFKMYKDRVIDSWLWPAPPQIKYFLYTNWKWIAGEDWHDIVEKQLWDWRRFAYFIKIVEDTMKQPDRTMWIIFVDRKDVAYWLEWALNEIGVVAKAYTGDHSTKKREEILEYLTPKRWVMIATYQTAGVGFNWKPLNTAFYFMFVKFKWTVKQAIGRILRGADNPLLIDFVDNRPKIFWRQWLERQKAYKEEYWIDRIKLLWTDNQNLPHISLKIDEKYLKLWQNIVKNFKKEKESKYEILF